MAEPVKQKEKVYVAIDIESGGDSFGARIPAIGVCVGDEFGSVEETKVFCSFVHVPEKGRMPLNFEKRCWEEFWLVENRISILKRINDESKGNTEDEMLFEYAEFLNSLEDTYEGRQIIIVSNNPAFDLGKTDHKLHEIVGRMPTRYGSDGLYRWVEDPSEQAEGLPDVVKAGVKRKVDSMVKADHWPVNDAKSIYHYLIEVKRAKKALDELAVESLEFKTKMAEWL
jgi:hypothetical protein